MFSAIYWLAVASFSECFAGEAAITTHQHPAQRGEIIVTIAPRICEAKGKVVVLLQLRLELQNSRILFSDSAAMVLPRPRFAGAGVGC